MYLHLSSYSAKSLLKRLSAILLRHVVCAAGGFDKALSLYE